MWDAARPGTPVRRGRQRGRIARSRVPPGLATFAAIAILAGSAMLVAVPTAEAATTRALAITASSSGAAAWKTFDGNPPKTFDIDGDGRQEILAQNDNNNLYIFHSGTGKLLATLKSTYPSGWGARTFNGPEAYRQDGVTHVVQMNSAAYLTSWRFNAAASTSTSFVFVKEWERRQTDCFSGPGADSKPVLADLDKDGKLEILVSTEESGIYAIRNTGALYWKKCIGGGNGEPRYGDINVDGFLDVVFASDGGVVTAANGRTGSTMWTFSIKSHYPLSSASVPVGAGIGQLDGLAGPDIVVGARDSHDAVNWTEDHALLLALSSTGKVLWARQDMVDGNPLTYTHPIIADAAGDGKNEVYWADWNTIGHKPPFNEADSWKTTGPANFYRFDHLGNRVWKISMSTFWNNKDMALADADGDGQQEILATGPGNGHEGIWYINSATGAKETFVDAYPWQVTRGPVIADLRGDGRMQFVLETGPMATTAGPAVQVFEMNVPYNAKWPNVNAPISTAGGGTGTPTPTPTSSSSSSSSSPPPGTGFSAPVTAFRGNEWWAQAQVGSNGLTVTKVDVRVDNGAWQSMTKQSWGTTPPSWGGSYHFPQGSVLQLRATASDGQTDLSSCRQWIPPANTDAAIVPCSGSSTSTPPPTSSSSSTGTGTFQASFSPKSVGNDWWVEVAVTSSQPLAKVEASRNGGAYVALDLQSWGNWAKSLNTPNGTVVVFRATSTGGATATSAPAVWT
ncbi:MAG TPA: VCBS repeat-containing protein [Candidatus Thermoplasmatota archaeon]|nr:VCBS repeat-containing protein [Candidatus Thermoplasmatota archaeon]